MTPDRALLALHGAVLLFGFAGLFGKWLALPPVAIVFGRTLVAAVALLALRQLQRGGRGGPLPWRDGRVAANGAILAVHWVTFFAAIQVSSVALGLLGFASFPLFVLLLERTLLGRRWQRAEMLTAALVTAGLVLLVPAPSLADRAVQGLLWGIASGFTFALLAVRNRALAAAHPAADLAFGQNLWAALALAPAVAWAGVPLPDAHDIGLVLLLGIGCTALAHTLFIAALARVRAHTASVVAALEPVYGIALAFALLGEAPAPRTLGGGALIVAAALHATRAQRRQFR